MVCHLKKFATKRRRHLASAFLTFVSIGEINVRLPWHPFTIVRTRPEQLDVSAYRCVAVAVRNRQNQLRPPSPLRPVVTGRVLYTNPVQGAEFNRRALATGIAANDR
jgi:hypothetical protein